jgi:hypothetical protein
VWSPCKDLFCTNIKVPLNHNDPEGELIDIEISKLPAPNQPALKTIIIHPDGPGIDGIAFLSKNRNNLPKFLVTKLTLLVLTTEELNQSPVEIPKNHLVF